MLDKQQWRLAASVTRVDKMFCAAKGQHCASLLLFIKRTASVWNKSSLGSSWWVCDSRSCYQVQRKINFI